MATPFKRYHLITHITNQRTLSNATSIPAIDSQIGDSSLPSGNRQDEVHAHPGHSLSFFFGPYVKRAWSRRLECLVVISVSHHYS